MAQELIDKIRAAAQASNVDPDVAVRIAQVESSLNPAAQAKTSSAKGLFQVIDSTWKQYGGKPGKQTNADENIRVGVNILADNTNRLRSALGRDPSASELYAAHFFGPGTAPAVLSASPDTPISELLSQRAVKANPQLQGKTAGEVRQMLQAKMGEAPVQPKAAPSDGREGQPDFEAIGRGQMTADLGSGYKAALALSFLGDEEESEEKKLDEEEKSAAKALADYKSFNALNELEFEPSKLPAIYAQASQPQAKSQPQQPVQKFANGGMPFVPTAQVRPSFKRQLTSAKAEYDAYNKAVEDYNAQLQKYNTEVYDPYVAKAEAYNKAAEAWNAGPRTEDFTVPVPTAPAEFSVAAPKSPSMTQEQVKALSERANKDVRNRNLALQVVANPEAYGLSINKMFADGGEVEGAAAQMLKQVVPMDVRTFGSTLFGSREPITEKNFTKEELAAMQQAVDTAVKRTGQAQKGSVQYVDYPRGEQIGPDFKPVGQTLGRFSYEKQPDGTTVIRDRYDFYNEGRKGNVEAYEKMGKGEKALTVSGRALKNLVTGNLRGIPDELADAYIGREGRDVTIQLPAVRRAGGGDAEPTPEEIAAASRPATFNPQIARQGAAARQLAAMRDVNRLADPRTYAAVTGFLGVPPDEQGFSVMHPDIAGIKRAGETGFYAGTAAQVAPVVGGAAKMLGKLTGSALNERLLAGQSLTPGFSTPAPISFAVKPKGGVFGYTGTQGPAITRMDELMDKYAGAARDASDEVQQFILSKAPKYFSTTFGTADDPLRTAIREKRLEPFGRDVKQGRLPPYLIDAAADPANRANLQARLDLERAYDELTGIEAYAMRQPGATTAERDIRSAIGQKMGEEGVPAEVRNPPSVNIYAQEDFAAYPISSRVLREMTEQQSRLPPHLQQALRTGEPIYDVQPSMQLLSPETVVEALQQVPPNKLKNMSFPEALIQGNQALAPIRDYRKAIDLAERGAAVPRQALDMFTKPVAPASEGQWVQITNPVATELEGKLMNHSVGGYGSGSSYGTGYTQLPYGGKKAFDEGLVQVYSLRDSQGRPSVTVEVAKSDGGKGNTWDVTQVRGRFNSEPASGLYKDVFKLFDQLDAQQGLGKIKSNRYTKSSTGSDLPEDARVDVDWAREYDNWLLSAPSE